MKDFIKIICEDYINNENDRDEILQHYSSELDRSQNQYTNDILEYIIGDFNDISKIIKVFNNWREKYSETENEFTDPIWESVESTIDVLNRLEEQYDDEEEK